jgi:hypothetical protein
MASGSRKKKAGKAATARHRRPDRTPRKAKPRPGERKPARKAAPPARPAKAPASAPTPPPAPARAESKPAGASHKKSGRKSPSALRRGPGGELIPAGEIVLPGGAQTTEEIQYLFRGAIAAERDAFDLALEEVMTRRPPAGDPAAARGELRKQLDALAHRFEGGSIEAMLPTRPVGNRRGFHGIVERARTRRREIGAFLRGLDLGRTETSHMDSHGEASLQSLMEWAARLEILMEADDPGQADYTQFHRVLDQLESNTEALVVDVEATLRRLRDRIRASERG